MEETNKMVEDWYNNVCNNINIPLISNDSYLSPVTKLYVDDQIINAPIVCQNNEISFSINDQKKLVLKETGIFWYNQNGEEFEIFDSRTLSIALEAVVRKHFGYDSDVLYKKMKKQLFNEMISDIGIQGERLIKLEKFFNEKNNS